MKICDRCGKKDSKTLWAMSWFNGICTVTKRFCPACILSGKSPPIERMRLIGTVRVEHQEAP